MRNWLPKIFRRSQGITATNFNLSELLRQSNYSGVSISAESILGNPTVYRAVNLVAGSCAKIPVHIYRYTSDGREKATALPQYSLLLRQPHPFYSAYNFKHSLFSNALIYGNAYAYIVRNEFATPQSLLLLDSRSTTVETTRDGDIICKTSIDNKTFAIPHSDILHIKGLSLNGISGLPLLDILSNAYGYGLSVQRYAAGYFRNNGKPSIAIELPGHLKDAEKIKEFARLWSEQHNSGNPYSPAFLANGTKIHPYSSSNDAGQLIENLEHDIQLVANCIGVPATKLGSKQNTSYSSLESETQAFLSDIDCWLVQFEQECFIKLLSESSKINNTHYIEFERRYLIKIDQKTESDILIAEYNNGIKSFEEMRASINSNIDKDNKQEWRRPNNIVNESEEMKALQDQVTKQAEQIKATPPPAPPAAQEEPPKAAPEERSKLERMAILSLDRLLTRAAKSKDLESNRSIFVQSLSPFENAAEFTDELFEKISTAEDHTKFIESLDAADLVKELK